MSQKVATVLCILDGFGLNPSTQGNAVALGDTPVFDRLFQSMPTTTLLTHGERVGLPEGQMGNSEVGHLNIGAGRVVDQWLVRVGKELQSRNHENIPSFRNFQAACTAVSAIHLIGLFSDGGVHSHEKHLYDLIESLLDTTTATLCIHIITDGRDTGPNTALEKVQELEAYVRSQTRVRIATVQGRFYAMDRDKRWERVELAYRAIATGLGHQAISASTWLAQSYEQGVTDEFIEPAIIEAHRCDDSAAVVFWNFRADRMREIVSALCLPGFDAFTRPVNPPTKDRVLCFTEYDATFGFPFLFAPIPIENFLGQVISKHGLTQLRAAETEKYPHVTYFLNGGSEIQLPGEDRSMVPSPRDVKTYDLKPEMSAFGVRDVVLQALEERRYDLIVVNFANCDMVGHTGVLPAAIKAVETVDRCLGQLVAKVQEQGGQIAILADHGNAEQMVNPEDGTPHTAHTTFPVPFILVGTQATKLRPGGALCDVAPTLLEIMGIPKPTEMTGRSLLQPATA